MIGEMNFKEMKSKIRNCKTKSELDDLRMPMVEFVPKKHGNVEEFYKLQKTFRTQKIRIARGDA